MRPRYFTVDEANALLPALEPLLAELQERRARVVRARSELEDILDDVHSDVGGAAASAMVGEFRRIEQLVHEVHAYGCLLKDMNAGLVDFLSRVEGREVYLCWRYGEPRVAFFHELHTGYNSRLPVQ